MRLLRSLTMKGVVFFGYHLGLFAVFYWLNRKAKRIIVFHNVLPDEIMAKERTSGSISVSALKRVIAEVKRVFAISTDLEDTTTATLTFDDGYSNQYEIIYEILWREAAATGYVFVNGKSNYPLVIDKLRYWKIYAPQMLKDGISKEDYWNKVIWPTYLEDAIGRGSAALEACEKMYPFKKVFGQLSERHRHLRFDPINEAQFGEMQKHGWKIGWHAMSHYPLAWLSGNQILEELILGKQYINECISYPYGADGWVDERAVAIVKLLGFPYGVSNVLSSNIGFSRHFLPRMHLPDNGRLRIHYELSGFGHFLRTGHLLPQLRSS